MRQSINSLRANENQSLNESLVANAIAEYYISGGQQTSQRPSVNQSMDSQKYRQIKEEAVLEKLNDLFDEIKKENVEFEESYVSLKKTSSQQDGSQDQSMDISGKIKPPKKSVTIVEQHPSNQNDFRQSY